MRLIVVPFTWLPSANVYDLPPPSGAKMAPLIDRDIMMPESLASPGECPFDEADMLVGGSRLESNSGRCKTICCNIAGLRALGDSVWIFSSTAGDTPYKSAFFPLGAAHSIISMRDSIAINKVLGLDRRAIVVTFFQCTVCGRAESNGALGHSLWFRPLLLHTERTIPSSPILSTLISSWQLNALMHESQLARSNDAN
jgi:hypothetical protein